MYMYIYALLGLLGTHESCTQQSECTEFETLYLLIKQNLLKPQGEHST
jgi:hypothetical protein